MKKPKILAGVHTHIGSSNNNKKIYIIKIDRNINPVRILDTA